MENKDGYANYDTSIVQVIVQVSSVIVNYVDDKR